MFFHVTFTEINSLCTVGIGIEGGLFYLRIKCSGMTCCGFKRVLIHASSNLEPLSFLIVTQPTPTRTLQYEK